MDTRRIDAFGFRMDPTPISETGQVTIVARAAGPLNYPRLGRVEYVDSTTLADGIETLRGVPVERGHGGTVIGRVETARVDSERGVILCDLVITDPSARADIAAGALAEASADYDIGRLDASNVQRGPFRYRALALIPPGVSRCGPTCSVQSRVDCMCGGSPVKIKIAGKEYEAGSVEAAEAMAAEAHRMDSDSHALAALRAERSRRIRSDAKRAGVESRKDADDTTVMQDVIAKVFPSVDLSSASPDFIAGAFACAIADLLDEDPSEPATDAAPKPPAADGAAPPPAAGAAGARADAFEARRGAAGTRKDANEQAPGIPPDVAARNKMIRRGASLGQKD